MMDFLDHLVNGRHVYDPEVGGYITVPSESAEFVEEEIELPFYERPERPACSVCGDPNYSLENPRCIACRISLPSGR